MSQELHRLTLAELGNTISSRAVSPREVVDACLRRIEEANPELNAFVTVCADQARRTADELTAELARGVYRGPLHGIPVAIKDLTDVAGVRTTYGSSLYREHVPVDDAVPVARLRRAGAIIVGKTNTHEFAFGTTTNNPHYGATHNPWRLGHVPGGSSGGSGAAVAAGLVPLATGSDTGGSIRIPSAACGVVGIKPTYGRVSLRGTYPLASSLDHVGPLARTAEDCAIALSSIAGYDPHDPWSRRFGDADFTSDLERPLRGIRVAIAPGFRPVALAPDVERGLDIACRTLAALGTEIVEVQLPDAATSTGAAGLLLLAESYAQHAEQFARDRSIFGKDVREQLEMSGPLDATTVVRALHDRERITRTVENLLSGPADALLLPTMAITAPAIGVENIALGGSSIPVAPAMASYTLLHNLTRLPTVAVPSGLAADGLPTSVQIAAGPAREALALAIAHQLERELWPHQRRWPGDEAATI